jgi:hypothetical protein
MYFTSQIVCQSIAARQPRMHLENGILLLPSGADKVPVTVQAAKQASPF